MWFPIDTAVGKVNQDGNYEIQFSSSNRDRVLQWISLTGPSGSTVLVYLDTIFMDTTVRGDFNRADYMAGIPIAKGRILRLVWNVGTGGAPNASIGCTDGGTTTQEQLTGNSNLFTG